MLKAHSSCTFPNRCTSRQRYVSESVGRLAPPSARMAFAARSPDSIAGRMPRRSENTPSQLLADQQYAVSGHVSFAMSIQKIRMA